MASSVQPLSTTVAVFVAPLARVTSTDDTRVGTIPAISTVPGASAGYMDTLVPCASASECGSLLHTRPITKVLGACVFSVSVLGLLDAAMRQMPPSPDFAIQLVIPDDV